MVMQEKIPAKVALSFIKTPDEPSVESINKNLGVTIVEYFFKSFIEMI